MTDKSPTPDLLPRFQRRSRFDTKPSGGGRNDADIVTGAIKISRSPAGRSSAMDSGRSTGGKHLQASLGAGSGKSDCGIDSGARAPKVDWSKLRG